MLPISIGAQYRVVGNPGSATHFEGFLSEMRYLHQVHKCGKSFNLLLHIGDLNTSVIQDAINTTGDHRVLEKFLAELLAYSHELMDERQRECFGFNGWYAGLMEKAIFGSAEDPIDVEE
ncbi:hypothetical protein BYT27DRAFT_7262981 [Phlegmacium glaucopus]|nr:hypothetical protein BYT27DRAFT_7262981 [Phlegmacium glaucopus]